MTYNNSGDNMSKDSFKSFARIHPELADVVLKGNASWQQLYELYEIYGENNRIWNSYIPHNSVSDNITTGFSSLKDFVNTFKNLDMDSVQKGITNIQKTIGLLQDIGTSSSRENIEDIRPSYRRFDD